MAYRKGSARSLRFPALGRAPSHGRWEEELVETPTKDPPIKDPPTPPIKD